MDEGNEKKIEWVDGHGEVSFNTYVWGYHGNHVKLKKSS